MNNRKRLQTESNDLCYYPLGYHNVEVGLEFHFVPYICGQIGHSFAIHAGVKMNLEIFVVAIIRLLLLIIICEFANCDGKLF